MLTLRRRQQVQVKRGPSIVEQNRPLAAIAAGIRTKLAAQRFGRVIGVRGALVEVEGLGMAARIGARVRIVQKTDAVEAEIIGLDQGFAQCMTFSDPQGLAVGMQVDLAANAMLVAPTDGWLGRVVDGLGRAVDAGPPLEQGGVPRALRALPPSASLRGRVGERLSTGVNALDVFVPVCRGQRLGLFAGSGVGKSVLMSMLARWTACDVAVIGLIGERGREVREFLEKDLGPDGMARSVVVVATSDEPALMRRQAAWTTLAIAEHFRAQGLHVLCLMDSVTRFAMAQREIGLSAGEPPATKGYTPTVFAELPRLLERAGPGLEHEGAITGLFTVLVDGDDHDEPIADAVRGILDGHVVLSRRIGERGRYPAIDLLKSVSRMLPHCQTDEENMLRMEAKRLIALETDMAEMVRLGAYQAGSDQSVDRAVAVVPAIEQLLTQAPHEQGNSSEAFAQLANILGMGHPYVPEAEAA